MKRFSGRFVTPVTPLPVRVSRRQPLRGAACDTVTAVTPLPVYAHMRTRTRLRVPTAVTGVTRVTTVIDQGLSL